MFHAWLNTLKVLLLHSIFFKTKYFLTLKKQTLTPKKEENSYPIQDLDLPRTLTIVYLGISYDTNEYDPSCAGHKDFQRLAEEVVSTDAIANRLDLLRAQTEAIRPPEKAVKP